MKPKGFNILVQPQPAEKVLASGIIIPDTVTPDTHEWGVVLDGNGYIEDGWTVLYFGKRSHESDGKKIVSFKKCMFWKPPQEK